MNKVTSKDGTEIAYKKGGKGMALGTQGGINGENE
jgi:hypothetical protein